MQIKTSISLSPQTLALLDSMADSSRQRSKIIDEAIRSLAAQRARSIADAKDIEILNRIAVEEADELADVLTFQVDL